MKKPSVDEVNDVDVDEDDDLGLDIELDEEEDGEEDLTIDLDEADESEEDKRKKANKAFAAMRAENKKLKDELSQRKAYVPPAAETPVVADSVKYADDGFPRTDEEWDALAQKDWKQAVDLRSRRNAANLIKEQESILRADKVLSESKQKVLARHPELNDNNSEKTRILRQIIAQNPEYTTHPKGPIFAMRDMEDYMAETLGYKQEDIVSAERRGAQREAERISRVAIQSASGRTPHTGERVVTLTKDEVDFCKHNEIDPKEYARNKQRIAKATKGGFEV